MAVNWTNDTVFQLIELYRERRLLWDHDLPDYKDKVKKQRSWQDIADVMDIDKDMVMKKMKILTTQFQREYARSRHLPPEEGSRWFAYTRMLFLGGNAATRTPAPHAACDRYPRVSPGAGGGGSLDECTIIEVKEEVDMSEAESLQSSASGRKRAGVAPTAPTAPVAPRDEYAVYGEYVALKLRKLTDAYTRHKAQQQINDVLFHAEMEDLSQ